MDISASEMPTFVMSKAKVTEDYDHSLLSRASFNLQRNFEEQYLKLNKRFRPVSIMTEAQICVFCIIANPGVYQTQKEG